MRLTDDQVPVDEISRHLIFKRVTATEGTRIVVHCTSNEYYCQSSNIRLTKAQTLYMFLISFCSCLCRIHWSQVLSREWRCSWSSAARRCSNYIWVTNNFIAYHGAPYIRDFTVGSMPHYRFYEKHYNILPINDMLPPINPIITAVMAALDWNVIWNSTKRMPRDLKQPMSRKFTKWAPCGGR